MHGKLVGEFEKFLDSVKQEPEDQEESEDEVELVIEPKKTKEKKKTAELKSVKSKMKSSTKKTAAKVRTLFISKHVLLSYKAHFVAN